MPAPITPRFLTGTTKLPWESWELVPFSTNSYRLQVGKVYYFRTAASNGSGSVVSESLGIFSTNNAGGITASPSTINPTNLKIWLDADSSNTLWQDAAASSAAANGNSLALWQDKSGNGYHFHKPTPTIVPPYSPTKSTPNSHSLQSG